MADARQRVRKREARVGDVVAIRRHGPASVILFASSDDACGVVVDKMLPRDHALCLGINPVWMYVLFNGRVGYVVAGCMTRIESR